MTREEHCQGLEKPQSEEECLNIACGAQYYMTDWSEVCLVEKYIS